MTMGIYELEDGLALVPLLIGVFVISEIIVQAEQAARKGLQESYKSVQTTPKITNRHGRSFFAVCR